MKRTRAYIYSVLLMMSMAILILFSCNKENAPDCFQQGGKIKMVKRDMEPFQSIELRDYLQIVLVDSSAYMVELEGPQNLLPEITTEIKDGKLKIENRNSCNFVRSYKNRITVKIFAPSFNDIQNFGTGDIRSQNVISSSVFKLENRNAAGTINLELDVDSATIATHTGVSDVFVKGRSEITSLFNQGLGIIDARNLLTQDAFVNNSSINDVYVNTNGYFFALIEFSGNIYYTGTPNHIDQDIRGEGRLMPYE